MSTTSILPERLAALDELHFEVGTHPSPDEAPSSGCMLEWVSWLAGEPWSDHPACVSPVIGAFCRSWNDGLPNATRDRLLKPLAPLVIGTATGDEDDLRRAWMCVDWTVRTQLPRWCDLTPALVPHAATLRALGEIDSPEALEHAREALRAAGDAAREALRAAGDAAWAARAAAWDAARAAAWDAARAAAWAAWDAARAAAWDAWAAAWNAAWDAAWNAGVPARAAAAGDAELAGTVEALQAAAAELVQRMCAVGAS